jgi:hypothetical protein
MEKIEIESKVYVLTELEALETSKKYEIPKPFPTVNEALKQMKKDGLSLESAIYKNYQTPTSHIDLEAEDFNKMGQPSKLVEKVTIEKLP